MSTMKLGFARFNKSVNKAHKKRTIAAADYAFRRVVTLAPVDTGAFRANINRSVGAPDFSFDESKTDGEAPQVISSKDYDDYYIASGAPYAGALENGHSGQAPNGVFKVAYNDLVRKFS